MGFDPASPSLVAALLSTPTVSRLLSAKDRPRYRRVFSRAKLMDHLKWLKHLEALDKSVIFWQDASDETQSGPASFVKHAAHPFVTGLLISSIAAFVLHFSGAINAVKHFTTGTRTQNEVAEIARFRRLPDVETEVKEKVREFEGEVDSIIENYSPGDSSLTKDDISKQQALIREVWETVNTSYYNARDPTFSKEKWAKLRDSALKDRPKSKSSARRIIRNMLAKGLKDPYAKLISPEEFKAMGKYDMTGVGLNVGSSEEFYNKVSSKVHGKRRGNKEGVFVLGLLQGSASAAAGIQQGDQIIEIDGEPVNGSSPYEAAQRIKGNSDKTVVYLKIKSKDGQLRDVHIDRPVTKMTPSVKTTFERQRLRRVARIQVSGCNSEARQEILRGLREVESKGVKEVVLDLRGNPGGLVEEAVEIAKLFLNEGSVVYIKRDGSEANETKVISHASNPNKVRLTVQIDRRTASAAEIIAGALRDNCRAVVAGEQSYGKGLIQSVFQLSDGSGLTLTVGKYYTPNMTDIDQSGIQPDYRRIPSVKDLEDTLKSCRVRKG